MGFSLVSWLGRSLSIGGHRLIEWGDFLKDAQAVPTGEWIDGDSKKTYGNNALLYCLGGGWALLCLSL
jgi:hypothetical protein